jgi:NAD(P)-dependent dehydrogenase (short-subunit alcohol dehydrogenase family)
VTAPVILITGSTDGIGRAVVRKLVNFDAEVIVHGIDGAKGRETTREIKQFT